MVPALAKEKCIPFQGDIEPLSMPQTQELLKQLQGWNLTAGHLHKSYAFPNFRSAVHFVNQVAEIANEQQHHPRICFTWGQVDLELWTYAIAGLHRNDFILAAHIDKLDYRPAHSK